MTDVEEKVGPKRHIVAIGGDGFSDKPGVTPLEDYVVALTGKQEPNICFIPTASGDDRGYRLHFYESFSRAYPRAQLNTLPLFRQQPGWRAKIRDADLVYVGGGNTVNMLLLWKHWGVERELKEAYERGTVLSGVSAGAACWFRHYVTDSDGNGLGVAPGLGFLRGSFSPHYENEKGRRQVYHRAVAGGKLRRGYACNNGVALHFINETMQCAVCDPSTQSPTQAFRLFKTPGQDLCSERALVVRPCPERTDLSLA